MTDIKKTLRIICFLLVFFAWVFPVSLFSQEDTTPEEDPEKIERQKQIDRLFKMSLEELLDIRINTAGKISQMIRDIPASVVLITREDIEGYGYQTITEVLESVPGLFAINDYEENGTDFGVRGFWSGVANRNMIILINGVQQRNDFHSNYPLNKILVPVEAIDRIEIIRGPMSVVYGNGAFYGVINIITNESTNRPVSMVSGSVGNLKTNKLFLRISGQSGDLNYSFNSSIYDTFGIDEPLIDMVENSSVLSSLGVPLTSRTGGRLENNEKYFNFSGNFKEFFLDVNYNQSGKEFFFAFPSVDKGSIDNINATNLSFGFRKKYSKKFAIESRLSYIHTQDSFKYDVLFKYFYGIQQLSTKSWEFDFNSFFTPSRKLDVTSGVYYKSIFDASNMFDLPSFGTPSLENNNTFLEDGSSIVTRAFYSQITYSPVKKLRIVAGVRLEQSPKYTLGKTHIDGGGAFLKLSEVYDQAQQIEFIPRIAALYSLNNRTVFKFLYGKAINRPSFFQNTKQLFERKDVNLEPESIETIEFNYISTFSDRFSLNLSVFRNTLNNLITRVVKNVGTSEYESWSANAGKMVTSGIELSIKVEPIEYLRMDLSATYQNTEDKREGFENISVGYSPKFLGYFKANYLAVGFKVAVSGTYVGEMESYWDETLQNSSGTLGGRIGERVKGYFVLGANLRFDDMFITGLFLNIRCSNLLNKEIRYPTFTNNDWAKHGTIGIGRTFLLSLGYKF